MRHVFLSLAVSVVAVGCAKRVPVSYEQPPPVFIEANAPVFVHADTSDQGGGTNFLQVLGSVGDGLALNRWAAIPVAEREFAEAWRRSGRTVSGAEQGAVLKLEIDPKNWQEKSSNDSKVKHTGIGVLSVDVKLIDPTQPPGSPPVMTRTFRGEGVLGHGEQNAMNEAARAAAGMFLAELAPKHVARRLPLDKSDPLAEPGIQACENDRFDEALQLFSEASVKAPQSAPLVYNRGVLTLWKGQLEEADTLLSQAVKMRPDEGDYADAKAFSEDALRAKAGWGGRTPPPPPR